MVDGIPYGKGKEITSDGEIYEGDFVNGLPEGMGKITKSNGIKYEGNVIGLF